MNSISKENNFNFPRILVRRIILNWQITPKSTTHIYRIKRGGGSGQHSQKAQATLLLVLLMARLTQRSVFLRLAEKTPFIKK